MRQYAYLGVLLGCLLAAGWLEFVIGTGVARRWRRVVLTLVPVAAVFLAWDAYAIAAGHWTFSDTLMTGIELGAGLPLEEVAFFLVIPVCSILGYEAVRLVRGR